MNSRIEAALAAAVSQAQDGAPPKFASALQYTVFPGGARVRPRLCLAVAAACGDDAPALSDAAAASIELLHCASLVHDDLPCFDDASLRRGKPSVHRVYGEPLAVLVGDALIVLAFETLARAGASAGSRLLPLLSQSAAPVGRRLASLPARPGRANRRRRSSSTTAPRPARSSPPRPWPARWRREPPEPWRAVGEKLGEAYQVADDLLDAVGSSHEVGKPTLRDAALARPSAVALLGVGGAVARLRCLLADAVEAVPSCPGALPPQLLVMQMADRLVPEGLKQTAA